MKKYNLILGLVIPFLLVSCGGTSSSHSEVVNHITGNYIHAITQYGRTQNIKISNIDITGDTTSHKHVVLDTGIVKFDNVPNTPEKSIYNDTSKENIIRIISTNSKYKDSIFGFFTDSESNKMQGYAFSQGNGTKNKDMPTTGVVTYQGNAIITKQKRYTNEGGWMRPHRTRYSEMETSIKDAKFTVNFANKKLTGNIDDIQVTADIKDNKFAGQNKDNKVETKGGFYGPDAAEMSGVFKRDGDYLGAFGAVKTSVEE